MISAGRWYAEIGPSTDSIARLAARNGLDLDIPACPGWTLRQLATHVGRAHRWAAEITGTRSAEFIEFRSVPDGRLPAEPADVPGWLAAGAWRLVSTLREAGDDPVWAFGEQRPASFWARRMAHETMVHRADAQLAAGTPAVFDTELAADAIDEWLTVMSGPLCGRPDPRLEALPPGHALSVQAHADAADATGTARGWRVRHQDGQITVTRSSGAAGTGSGEVGISGQAGDVLLVLLRRIPLARSPARVSGDARLLTQWLAGTPC